MTDASTQTSQLMPALFRAVNEDRKLRVLHFGQAAQETLDFFSRFRCRLHIVDLRDDLPIPQVEETSHGLEHYISNLLMLPADSAFDLCLFWDLFNYLDAPALAAFSAALQPHLATDCLAHGFSVHNRRTGEHPLRYGIVDPKTLSLRERVSQATLFAPHSQNRLQELLIGFRLQRSVLLADGRLELLLARAVKEPSQA